MVPEIPGLPIGSEDIVVNRDNLRNLAIKCLNALGPVKTDRLIGTGLTNGEAHILERLQTPEERKLGERWLGDKLRQGSLDTPYNRSMRELFSDFSNASEEERPSIAAKMRELTDEDEI